METLSLGVRGGGIVAEAKSHLEDALNTVACLLRLGFEDAVLEDDRLLAYYNVHQVSTLRLIPTSAISQAFSD